MTDRIIEIAEDAADLRVRNEQLIVERNDFSNVSIPLCDIAVLIVSNPRINCTQAVFGGIVEHGGAFVCCDRSHLPVGMLLPLTTHHLQTERIAMQIECKKPLRKRIWQQVVCAKIRAQADTLQALCNKDAGLPKLVHEVKSGDTTNREAQASRRYWPLLFGKLFRRNRQAEDHNQLLNYGYAILRAAIARALCAAGLHPSIGVHHHNRYDQFCLADDMMEPLRPLIDRAVFAWWKKCHAGKCTLDRAAKAHLLRSLTGRVLIGNENRTLFDAASHMTASLVAMLSGKSEKLTIPVLQNG